MKLRHGADVLAVLCWLVWSWYLLSGVWGMPGAAGPRTVTFAGAVSRTAATEALRRRE